MTFGMADSITGDLLRLALDADSGKLVHCGVLAEAARGALMVDLVRTGALWRDGDTLGVDTTPTGFALADELLGQVTAHPDHTLERWLQRGVPHLHEFVAELLADGAWSVRRHGLVPDHARYTDAGHDGYTRLRTALRDVAHDETRAADERQAALCRLAIACGLVGDNYAEPGSSRLAKACGDLEWIVSDVVTYLVDAQADDIAAGFADGGSTVLQTGAF